jgi:putative phosphoribosyl transferase
MDNLVQLLSVESNPRTACEEGRPMPAELHEREEFRDKHLLFGDRIHAGEVLSEMLAPIYQSRPDVLVMAIPSGGVPVGLEISRRLSLGFDMIIVRKLQIPGNTEAGFGALSLGGRVYLNEHLLARLGLDRDRIEEQIGVVRAELETRNRLFRKGRPLPELSGTKVILCDDGLASGYTMLAAAGMAAEKGATRITVAVPTAPMSSIRLISPVVDEIWCASIQTHGPFAVANAYTRWHDLDQQEVIGMLLEAGETIP